MKETFSEESNGVFHYIDNTVTGLFTDEEIAERNQIEIDRNAEALKEILADGFIEVPIFFRDNEWNRVEKKAWVHPDYTPSCSVGYQEKYGISYNIYVPSYKRPNRTKTIETLKAHGITNYYLAIDPDQYSEYKKYHDPSKLIIRDISFRADDMIDLASSVKSPNSMHGHSGIVNFLFAFSKSMGESHFWTMDDDIVNMAMKAYNGTTAAPPNVPYDKENYYRCSNILPKYGFSFSKFLRSMEEMAEHSRNPGFIGLEKFGLVFQLPVMWKLGTRVYTFYLTDNLRQCKHWGQHNNDVITSLELSKRGMVNMLFEGICYNSEPTQSGGGGQVEVYQTFGTFDKGKVLVRAQPNYAKIAINYNRIHHSVNYTTYNQQRLVGAPVVQERYIE